MGFKSITVGFAGGVKERRARGATDGTRDKTRGQGGEDHRGARCPGRAAAVGTTRDVRASRVPRARRPSPPPRRALAQHGAATEVKTRDEEDDRRRDERRGEDHRGARCPG
jgi:hypothetical protein